MFIFTSQRPSVTVRNMSNEESGDDVLVLKNLSGWGRGRMVEAAVCFPFSLNYTHEFL